jgi:GNAT superfamily N-acetyltransferase
MNDGLKDIHIRSVDLHDLPEISLLSCQLGYPNSEEDLQERLEKILANPDQAIFTVDITGKNTAGYIHAVKHVSLEVGTVVEVRGLVINQEFRRQGLGKALLAAAEEWAREIGCKQIRLHSNIIREGAHQFYKDMGYSIKKTQHQFIKNLDG